MSYQASGFNYKWKPLWISDELVGEERWDVIAAIEDCASLRSFDCGDKKGRDAIRAKQHLIERYLGTGLLATRLPYEPATGVLFVVAR